MQQDKNDIVASDLKELNKNWSEDSSFIQTQSEQKGEVKPSGHEISGGYELDEAESLLRSDSYGDKFNDGYLAKDQELGSQEYHHGDSTPPVRDDEIVEYPNITQNTPKDKTKQDDDDDDDVKVVKPKASQKAKFIVGGGALLVGVLGVSALLSGQKDETVAGEASVGAIEYNDKLDGRNNLSSEQAQYLYDKTRNEANQNKEGVGLIISGDGKGVDVTANPNEVNSYPDTSNPDSSTGIMFNGQTGEMVPILPSEAIAMSQAGQFEMVVDENSKTASFKRKSDGQTVPLVGKYGTAYSLPTDERGNIIPEEDRTNKLAQTQNQINNRHLAPNDNEQEQARLNDLERQKRREAESEQILADIEARKEALGNEIDYYTELVNTRYQQRQELISNQDLTNQSRSEFYNNASRQLYSERKALASTSLNSTLSQIQGQNSKSKPSSFSSVRYPSVSSLASDEDSTNQEKEGGLSDKLLSSVTGDKAIDSSIIRAGTKWRVIINQSVNSDDGTRVEAKVLDGRFSGATVYGNLIVNENSLGIEFVSLAPSNKSKSLIPVSAVATTIGENSPAVHTRVNNHFLRNFGANLFSGYADAYENYGTTTLINSDGDAVAVKSGDVNNKQIVATSVGSLGDAIVNTYGIKNEKQATYFIDQGTVVNMLLTENLDTKTTTDSIGLISASN